MWLNTDNINMYEGFVCYTELDIPDYRIVLLVYSLDKYKLWSMFGYLCN